VALHSIIRGEEMDGRRGRFCRGREVFGVERAGAPVALGQGRGTGVGCRGSRGAGPGRGRIGAGARSGSGDAWGPAGRSAGRGAWVAHAPGRCAQGATEVDLSAAGAARLGRVTWRTRCGWRAAERAGERNEIEEGVRDGQGGGGWQARARRARRLDRVRGCCWA
jgi:hypothetical protein